MLRTLLLLTGGYVLGRMSLGDDPVNALVGIPSTIFGVFGIRRRRLPPGTFSPPPMATPGMPPGMPEPEPDPFAAMALQGAIVTPIGRASIFYQ